MSKSRGKSQVNQLVDESEMSSINFSQDEKEKKKKQRRQGEGTMKGKTHGEDEERQQSNTIMQQINNFSLTPMNDVIAEKTIEDHKYLLELVENRCAISYFAAVNRNQSLYFALKKYHTEMK